MMALDTETTGLDLFMGAKPFFVTTCDDENNQTFWEWCVDTKTRKIVIPQGDLEELTSIIEDQDVIVCHNSKFDVAAMASVIPELRWPWDRTEDTLLAGHLLASNHPHNLTDMAVEYLRVDIQPYEDRLEECVKECRRLVQQARLREKRGKEAQPYAKWRIAEAGLPEMPSAKESTWKYDTWLPRAMAKHLTENTDDGLSEDHPWWTVLRDYANADSAVTIQLWQVQKKLLEERGLWAIYQERRKLLPVVYGMESRGITVSVRRINELETEYLRDSEAQGRKCKNLAESIGYDLTLPKSGNNKSLLDFCFSKEPNCLGLTVLVKTEKGNASLDSKNAIPAYLDALNPNSRGYVFLRTLDAKRKRDTSINYLANYQRFMTGVGDYRTLHPGLNPTGTDTLRFSSDRPNSQNISSKHVGEDDGREETAQSIRYCFGPMEGREWWSLDYENIELRIPAYESGEESMIELFEKPNDPPYFGSYHLLNASIIFPELFWPVAEKKGAFKEQFVSQYKRSKNTGFAIQYGCQEAKADATAGVRGAYRAIKKKLPKVTKLTQGLIDFANRHGYVETIPDKTVSPERGYPLLCTRSEWGSISPTIPLSYHVQSTAMWCTMKAMIRVHSFLQELTAKDPRGYFLALQVHDEIVLDFPKVSNKGNLPKVRKVAALMRQSGEDIGIPLRVSIEYNPENWGEGEKV